jgi:RNA polymerase sigma factor (sigma-70 family)
MNPAHRSRRIRRAAGVLPALLAPITLGPAAFASSLRADPPGWLQRLQLPGRLPPLPPGWNKHPPLPGPAHVRASLAGGMPGWQITLIAVAAAVVAAVLAVLLTGPGPPGCLGARQKGHSPMPSDPSLAGLVTRAQDGDQRAWDVLVERYAPLLWSICHNYRLAGPDAADVSQNVWLLLADRLDTLRDPAALPSWLATTTRRECARARRAAARSQTAVPILGIENIPDPSTETAERQVLAAERHAALCQALACLPPDGQRLLALLIADPPVPTPRSALNWGSRSAASGPPAPAAWTSHAAIRPSPH